MAVRTGPVTSPSHHTALDDVAIAGLSRHFRGALVRPDDAAYDAQRRIWNGAIDRRPALIARCTGAADVRAAVGFARERELIVAVRGGGHNVAGTAVCDGGIVIDLSPMKGMWVDPRARTARAQPGLLWGEFNHETQPFGLATPGGMVSHTGIAGPHPRRRARLADAPARTHCRQPPLGRRGHRGRRPRSGRRRGARRSLLGPPRWRRQLSEHRASEGEVSAMTSTLKPDTSLVDAAREIAPIIREHSKEADQQRRLSRPVLDALRASGFLRMMTPRSLGGLETDPITRILVAEEIGRHDSAAAWTLENPLDWAFFCCRLPDEGVEEIYGSGPDVLIAAQFGRPLSATSTDAGYRISGRAPFVSNCYDANWISSTVVVDADQHQGGEPEMRMVYFPREQCEIIDTWDVMGMRGTGSNDISVKELYVPASRTFPMKPEFEPGSHYRGPLYRLPVVGAAATGIPRPMLSVARRALDEVTELALTKTPVTSSTLLKERASAQVKLGQAEAILRSGRLLLLDTMDAAWERCKNGEPHSLEQRAELLLAMAHAMSSAVQAVDLACSIAGTTAFRATNPLERCFRDTQTMRHHVFASDARYGTFGQVRLGVPPDFPVIAF
jgi:indole-3-acetate monooxygenase